MRQRIVEAAAGLLDQGGEEAVSTRAVSAAAGVQAPTLYRLFGDKTGLLAAVAEHGFAEYLAQKKGLDRTDDPVADLRQGWDNHVEFGVTRPAVYTLMYSDPLARPNPVLETAADLLAATLTRIAQAGRLAVSVPRAAWLVHTTGVGVVLEMIRRKEFDAELSVQSREMVVAAVTTARPVAAPAASALAVALQAALEGARPDTMTKAEMLLLGEWLTRIADRA